MNAKRKGTTAERKAMRLLEAAGYFCTRSGGSLGIFDLIAISRYQVRCIQVKAGQARLSSGERKRLAELEVPSTVSKECWTFRDGHRSPEIEHF